MNGKNRIPCLKFKWFGTDAYDAADQLITLHFGSQAGAYGHTYTYTPGGELQTRSEDDGGVNTFGYDGADQLVSEVRTGPVPFSDAYTYDHNGNRLTMTQNGSLVQSFSYNQHDVMTSGINETPSWDLNGNMTGDTLNGQHTGYTWDDEDRLTSITLPDGHTDSFSYNGLGMRLTKSDPTGSYAYLNDGFSPASPVLTDGYSTFTPGISETKGAAGGGYASEFYLADASGNSRGLLNESGSATDGYNWDAFGNLVSRFGSNPTMFAWNEQSGYQSDNDDGLALLGNRYYDKRTGRFISQDPAGDGDNWYAYCGNDPVDDTDPSGLSDGCPGSLGAPDQHYGGLCGYLGDDPGGIFGGSNNMDRLWEDADSSMARGQAGYLASLAAAKAALQKQYYDKKSKPQPVNKRQPGESDLHYFLRGLAWAIMQTITLQPTPEEVEYWGTGKAPWQVQPGIRSLKGEYIDSTTGRVEPWEATYDQYGRQIGRTDYNAGNNAANIPSTHYHEYGYNNGVRYPIVNHAPGEYSP